MGLQSNLYRRGAAYVWRRRMPAKLGGTMLQSSLRTHDPLLARRVDAITGSGATQWGATLGAPREVPLVSRGVFGGLS